MAPSLSATTDGSKSWIPDHIFESTVIVSTVHEHLTKHKFKAAIATAFELPDEDSFTYHANVSVTLSQAEAAIRGGRANSLHDWYVEPDDAEDLHEDGTKKSKRPSVKHAGHPPAPDIGAYISLFDPTKSTARSLKSLSANAKKGSLRSTVADYLMSKRHIAPSIIVPKIKPKSGEDVHPNPALDFWAYACSALEFAGPNKYTSLVTHSHHILPIYMHHFGCVVPSYEALAIIRSIAAGRPVIDVGSGNGYWTLMLRRHGLQVMAVDNMQSRWRTMWISDTAVADGISYLRKRDGCADSVLLLVYPIVSGEFTTKVLESYRGNSICVVGTQNENGYTGFGDLMIDEFMERRAGWTLIARVAVPSFPGKDDALFVFQRLEHET